MQFSKVKRNSLLALMMVTYSQQNYNSVRESQGIRESASSPLEYAFNVITVTVVSLKLLYNIFLFILRLMGYVAW